MQEYEKTTFCCENMLQEPESPGHPCSLTFAAGKKLKTTLPKTNEMKNQNMKLWAALALGAVCALPAQAQKQKAAVKDTVATVQHGANNMMLKCLQ